MNKANIEATWLMKTIEKWFINNAMLFEARTY